MEGAEPDHMTTTEQALTQQSAYFLLPPSHFLLPLSHFLLPPFHFLLPPSHFLLPPSHFLLPLSYFLSVSFWQSCDQSKFPSEFWKQQLGSDPTQTEPDVCLCWSLSSDLRPDPTSLQNSKNSSGGPVGVRKEPPGPAAV